MIIKSEQSVMLQSFEYEYLPNERKIRALDKERKLKQSKISRKRNRTEARREELKEQKNGNYASQNKIQPLETLQSAVSAL